MRKKANAETSGARIAGNPAAPGDVRRASRVWMRPGIVAMTSILAACANLPPSATPPGTNETAARILDPRPARVIPPPPPSVPARPVPDAVIALPPDGGPLSPQANQTLQEFAARLKGKRDLAIRLESFVPDGGSRELNVGLSASRVEQVRRRLVELGVPSYRIKIAPRGEEHLDAPTAADGGARIELYLVRLPR
jgi:type IV pilus biogenesis protein CpaD/CtpE